MKRILSTCMILFLGVSCNLLNSSPTVEVIKFKMVPKVGNHRFFIPVRLNKKGIGSIPFSNRKLLFKFENKNIYFDSNNDGEFKGVDAKPIDRKKLLSVPITLNGVQEEYKFRANFANRRMVYLISSTALEGEYKGEKIYLFDKNLNGDFSETGVDMISFGKPLQTSVIGNVISIGPGLFNLKIDNKSLTAKVQPYDKPCAKLKIITSEKRIAQFTISHEKSKFTTAIKSGEEKTIPAGNYKIKNAICFTPDPDNKRKRKDMLSGRGGSFEVAEGDNILKAGTPVKIEFNAVKLAKNTGTIKIQSASLLDALGAKYRAQVYYAKEKSSLSSVIIAGDKEKELTKMSYG